MKSKCSFILKASTALVLALLMLFGTVTTSVAAVVDNAKTASEADADTSTEAHGAEGFFAALRRNTPDLADTGKKADLAETGDHNWNDGDFRLIGSINNWSTSSNYVSGVYVTTGDNANKAHYADVYLYGSTSETENTTNWYYYRFYEADGKNVGFCPNSDNDTNMGTGGWQKAKEGTSGAFYIKRKTLSATATNLYRVRIYLKHQGADNDLGTWYEKTQISNLSPSVTTKNGSTSTTSFEIGDTISLSASVTDANKIGKVTYSYKYKKSTDSNYTSISGTSLNTSSLSAGTYTIQVTATDDGMVAGKNAQAARTAETATKDITLTAPACTPKIQNEAGTAELSNTTIYSCQQLKFKVYDPNNHTSTLSITKGGSAQTASTYLSSTTGVASGSVVTFTPTAGSAATYVITQSCSGGGSDSVTITVKSESNVYFKHSTTASDISGGGQGTQATMTYDATASAALSGGKASHVVYKATLSNWSAATHYWVIYDGNDSNTYKNRYSSTPISNNKYRIGGTAASTTRWTSVSGSTGSINTSSIGTGTTVVYYDIVDNKFYAELPIKVTYQGYCSSQSKNVGTAATEVKAYGATATSGKTITGVIGYTQVTPVKWYTTSGMTTEYTFPVLTGNITSVTIYSPMTANTYTITLDAATNGGTIGTTSFTHTYGVASSLTSYIPTPPTGYTNSGWFAAASGGSAVTSIGATAVTANKTYYAQYAEITGGAVAKAYTDGNASNTGGTVKVGSGTAGASANLTKIGITSSQTVTAAKKTGYDFNGWTFAGDNRTHLKYSFDGTNYTAVTGSTTTVGTSSNTTIYIKTDGTSDISTSNAEVRAMFVYVPRTLSVTQKYFDNGTIATGNKATVTGAGTYAYNASVTVSVSSVNSDYAFVGWYNAGAGNDTAPESTNTSYTFTMPDSNKSLEARFRKKYYLTAYSSWVPVGGDFSKVAAPPTKVEVLRGTTVVATYTYSHLTAPDNTGEDAVLITASGTFHEGNKLQILGGYNVKLYYSALGSSEAIRGIFFNNGIRYTMEGEADNSYTNGSPVTAGTGTDDNWKYTYEAATTLFADENLYSNTELVENGTYAGQPKPTAIAACKSGYQAEVDQSTHIVSFTAAQNYRNIDLELGSKFRVFFANSDGAVIQSKNLDNYYSMGEQLSGSTEATYFTIKAEGNTDQINSIDKDAIKVYPADSAGNKTSTTPITPFTFTYSSGSTAITNGGTNGKDDSTAYIKITGTMPNQNVVIEINPTVKYNMYLDSKIVADGVESKTKLRQVANITATVNNAAFQSQSQSDTAGNAVGANAVVAGTTIKYTYAFTGSWSSYYTFNGWYTGDSTGPDYTNGYITDKQTLNYTPRKNVYIYAVGTRDLYINGNQYITGATENWNYKKNSSGKYLDSSGNVTTNSSNYVPVNYKMSFDPTLGTVGKYYWTITEDMYSRVSGTGYNFGGGVTKSGDYYYWSNSNNMGNAWFQFFDEAEGWNRDSVWYKGGDDGARLTQVYSDTTGKITYGRIRKASNSTDWKDQMGAFKFKEADSPGYSAPITIYYDPAGASGNFTVEPSYVYPNIYLSHGYAVGSTTRLATATGTYQSELKWLNGTTESDTNITGPIGNGWTPNHEGHVNHYKVTKKDATVRVKKTVNAADKVTAFFVYDLYDNKVYAIRDVSKSSNTYYADIKMQTGHDLYICPIIEAGNAKMTVYFDATQLNSNRWGKIVSCYAWYGSGNAQGDFPGQPMIPSDDGTSWSATFPSTKDGSELAGITFSNYVDGNSTAGHSWLAMNGVMPSVTDNAAGTIDTSSSILKFKYNDMGTADNGNTQYRRINCKVQTYDYREPISYFKNNQEVDHADNLTLTFAIKMGNSDSVMSLRHSELKTGSVNGSTASANIFSGITHTHSDGSETSTHKFTAKNFQYLTNAKGDQYTDLNGVPLGVGNKPSATYYVIAKGEVVYNNGNLEQVFWSGKRNQSKSAIGFYKTNDTISDNKDSLNTVPTGAGAVNETYTGASMDYGVEWYIYDADGNYITNILSAGYADYESLTGTVDTDSVVGSRLKELGYAVDGKSVAICYDKPRYMYTDDKEGNTKRINSGNYFDSFRATGQWYKNEAYQTATVSVGVAMMTDSGEVLAATNDGGYGNAWARYDTTKGTYASYASPTPLGNEYASVTAAQKDAVNTPIVLRASHDNFQGWYYYDPGTNVFTKASYTGYENFRPNYSKDIKYYAVYRAAAIYKFKYVGREGDDYYTVSGGDLTETELTDNLVRVNEAIRSAGGKYSVAALAPDDNKVSVFKRDFDFTQTTTKDNTTPYFLNVGTFENTVSSFELTYYYPNSKGGNLASHSKTAAYGSTVDLQSIASTVTANAPEGQQFIGWYEYDPDATGDKYGNLLTTQSNYGFVITKAQTIAAKYASTAPTDDGVWQAYIDDNGITRQMNSSSTGKYYNDTIVRFRCGQNAATHVPNGAEVGVLIINDGGTNGNITANETQLNNFANNLTNGATGKVGSQGKTVTKLCKSITDANGSPLTYYNRYDFALRSDYSAAVETKYTVYAYVKINGSYKWSTVASGTYTATE